MREREIAEAFVKQALLDASPRLAGSGWENWESWKLSTVLTTDAEWRAFLASLSQKFPSINVMGLRGQWSTLTCQDVIAAIENWIRDGAGAAATFGPKAPPPPAPPAPVLTEAPGFAAPPAAAAADEAAFPDQPSKPPNPIATIVRVFYSTDRRAAGPAGNPLQYGTDRSENGALNYGRCEVSIPKVHKMGKLESPSWLRFEFKPDPAKHIILAATESLEEEAFFQQVAAQVQKSAKKDAFVFVHGYNVSFEDAARRTGQMAFDLGFVGAPVFYSWPSAGNVADYLRDETNVAWSAPHFQRFLMLLSQRSGAERIHVIAHSMGNRAVCEALKTLSANPANATRLHHVVLAAADIDADTFQELASAIQKVSEHVTLYESSQDKALLASKKIHGYRRAGEPLLLINGMDTIDASAIDTDFLGHSYFSDNWPLLSDIYAILFDDKPAAGRFGLQTIQGVQGSYYAFKS